MSNTKSTNNTAGKVSVREQLSRISISLPESLLRQFDEVIKEKEYDNRSKAIADVLQQSVTEHFAEQGSEVMVGTINLVFDHSVPNLQNQLADIQHTYIDEVISSLNVNLEHNKTMSVILVQGPADKLKAIANEMFVRKGVTSGKLLLNAAIIPQVHPLPSQD